MRYRCMVRSLLREECAMTSKKSGQLKIGEVVEVVEQRTNEKGVLRMRIAGERG